MAEKTKVDQQAAALAKKLDDDLNDFIQEQVKISHEMRGGAPKHEPTLEELVEELKDHPAFATEIDMSKPLHPLVEGLQEIKYNSEDAYDNAESYKDDGNNNFKFKNYRFAVASYTEGIKSKCADKLLNAQLYSNRGAANFHLGNFRSSFIDCLLARKFKPDHLKAIVKGIQCSIERRRYDDAIKWCDDALLLSNTDKQALDLREKAERLKKQQERDARREAARERKQQAAENKLIDAIKSRGIKLAGLENEEDSKSLDPLLLSSLESHHPSGAKVHVDETGALRWPVMFMYPEYTQTDFIEAFSENDRFEDHIEAMFGAQTDPAPWDDGGRYKPHNLEIYFEEKTKEKIYRIKPTSTLAMVLKHEKHTVHAGTPSFIILAKDGNFTKAFLKKCEEQS